MQSNKSNQASETFSIEENEATLANKSNVSVGSSTRPVKTVCITGAAGKIAYSFIPLLCSGEVLGPKTLINLKLLTT